MSDRPLYIYEYMSQCLEYFAFPCFFNIHFIHFFFHFKKEKEICKTVPEQDENHTYKNIAIHAKPNNFRMTPRDALWHGTQEKPNAL